MANWPHPPWAVTTTAFWHLCTVTLLLSISISDIMWRKVRNELVLVGLLMATGIALRQGGPSSLGWAMGQAVAGGLMMVPAYAMNRVGAADVKVFFVYSALAGPGGLGQFVLISAIFAGLLGTVALWRQSRGDVTGMVLRVQNSGQALDEARVRDNTIPLTVALSGGLALTLLREFA